MALEKQGNSSSGITEIAILTIALNTAIGQCFPTGLEMVISLFANLIYRSPTSLHWRIKGIPLLKSISTQYSAHLSVRKVQGIL